MVAKDGIANEISDEKGFWSKIYKPKISLSFQLHIVQPYIWSQIRLQNVCNQFAICKLGDKLVLCQTQLFATKA